MLRGNLLSVHITNTPIIKFRLGSLPQLPPRHLIRLAFRTAKAEISDSVERCVLHVPRPWHAQRTIVTPQEVATVKETSHK